VTNHTSASMNKTNPDEYLLKICIIGSPDELKTRMTRTFAVGKFTTHYLPTLGVDITTKQTNSKREATSVPQYRHKSVKPRQFLYYFQATPSVLPFS